MNGKQRYAVNSVSYINPDTPLKLADYFKIGGVFSIGSIPDKPSWGNDYLATSVMQVDYRSYVEIVFQNWENTVQSWHIDGYSFFVVGWVSKLSSIKMHIDSIYVVANYVNEIGWMEVSGLKQVDRATI